MITQPPGGMFQLGQLCLCVCAGAHELGIVSSSYVHVAKLLVCQDLLAI